MSNFERQFFEYFQIMDRKARLQPLVLGGITASGGGTGSPIGGFIGQLPQTEVTYDLSEDATLDTVPSGESLLDNLNHIRYRIQTLETLVGSGGGSGSGGNLSIYDDGSLQGIASELDFTTGISVTVAAGRATIVNTGVYSNVNKIIRTNNSNTSTYEEYEKSDAGLAAAIADKQDQDVIHIPAGEYDISAVDISDVSLVGESEENTTIRIYQDVTDRWGIKADDFQGWNPYSLLKNLSIYIDCYYEFTADSEMCYGVYANNRMLENVYIEYIFEGASSVYTDTKAIGLWVNYGVDLGDYEDRLVPLRNIKIAATMEYSQDSSASICGIWSDMPNIPPIIDTFDIYVYNEYGKTSWGIVYDNGGNVDFLLRNGKIYVERNAIYQDYNNDTIGIYAYNFYGTLDNVQCIIAGGYDSDLTGASNTIGLDIQYSIDQYIPNVKNCYFDVTVNTDNATGIGTNAVIRTVGPALITNSYGVVKFDNSIVNKPTMYYAYPYDGGYGIPRIRFHNCGFDAKQIQSTYQYIASGGGSLYNPSYIDSFNTTFAT